MSSSQPIDIHYHALEEWVTDRKAVLSRINSKYLKEVTELAPKMVQICKYDIPALKKQQNRLRVQSEEFRRKLDNSFGQEDKLRKRMIADMGRFGLLQIVNPELDLSFLASSNVSKNISAQTSQMVAVEVSKVVISNIDDILEVRFNTVFLRLCEEIGTFCNEVLSNVFECYTTFLLESINVNRKLSEASGTFSCGQEDVTDEFSLPHSISTETLFPVLFKLLDLKDRVMAPGAQGVTEWTREKPLADAVSPKPLQEEVPVGITWEDNDATEAADTDGNKDFTAIAEGACGVEIDWGCLDEAVTDNIANVVSDNKEELMESAQGNQCLTDNELEYKKPLTESGIVFSFISQMISRPEVRGSIVDELEALSAFFKQSLQLPKGLESPVMIMDRVAKHQVTLQDIEGILQLLKDDTVMELLRMRSDVTCRAAFVDGLFRAYNFINTLVSTRSDFMSMSDSAAADANALDPTIDEAVKRVLGMHSKAEELMSKMLAPRPVYIVGDINTL